MKMLARLKPTAIGLLPVVVFLAAVFAAYRVGEAAPPPSFHALPTTCPPLAPRLFDGHYMQWPQIKRVERLAILWAVAPGHCAGRPRVTTSSGSVVYMTDADIGSFARQIAPMLERFTSGTARREAMQMCRDNPAMTHCDIVSTWPTGH